MKNIYAILIGAMITLELCSCNHNVLEKSEYMIKNNTLDYDFNSDTMSATMNNGLIYSLSYVENKNIKNICFDVADKPGSFTETNKEHVSDFFYTKNHMISCDINENENIVNVFDLSDKQLFTFSKDSDQKIIDVSEDQNSLFFLYTDNKVSEYSETGELVHEYNLKYENDGSFTAIANIAAKSGDIYCVVNEYIKKNDAAVNKLVKFSEDKECCEEIKELTDLGAYIDDIYFDSAEKIVVSGHDNLKTYIDCYEVNDYKLNACTEIEGVTRVYGEDAGVYLYVKDGQLFVYNSNTEKTESVHEINDNVVVNAIISNGKIRLCLKDKAYSLEFSSSDINDNKVSSELMDIPDKYCDDYLICDMYVSEEETMGLLAVNFKDSLGAVCVYDDSRAEWYDMPEIDLDGEYKFQFIGLNKEYAVIRNLDDIISYSFKDGSLKHIGVESQETLLDCCLTSDNKIVSLFNRDNKLYLAEYSTDNGVKENEKKIKDSAGTENDSVINGNNSYRYYLNADNKLTGIKANNSTSMIIDWENAGYQPEIYRLNLLDDQKFLCCSNNEEFYLIEKADESKQKVITVGILGGVTPDYSEYAKGLKKNGYMINIRDYCAFEENGDAGFEKFNLDIASGDIPDVLVFHGSTDIDLYRQKGLVEPLDQYLKSDKEIKREDYLENVFELNTYDGKLYYVTPQIMLRTIMGTEENKENTIEGLKETLNGYNLEQPFGDTSSMMLLHYLLAVNDIDYGQNLTRIKSCIELAEQYGDNKSDRKSSADDYKDYYEGFRNGRMKCMIDSVTGFECYNLYNKALFSGKMKLDGVSGNGKDNVAIECTCSMAITSKSSNKELAWSYIRGFLTDEYQDIVTDTYGMGFPVKINSLENAVKKAQDSTYAISYYPAGDEKIDVGYISDNEAEQLIDVIKNCSTKCSQNLIIRKIVDDEAVLYFNGEADIDTVVSSINKKVSLYLNETK